MNDLREEMVKQFDREILGLDFVAKKRPSFHNIMMNMALLVAQRSTCQRSTAGVGTVISSTDFRKVLSMGYNGNASGLPNGCDRTGPEAVGNCGCIHSEANAVINCDVPRSVEKLVFVTMLPCVMCSKYLINMGGVQHVYYLKDYRIRDSLRLLRLRGIRVTQYALPVGDQDEVMTPHHEPGIDFLEEIGAAVVKT